MGIRNNIKFGFIVAVLLLSGSACYTSCSNDEFDERTSSEEELYPAGTNTYYNFVLRLGDSAQTRGGAAGDTDGNAEENAVKNVAVIFFDSNDLFETAGYFNVSDLTSEDGSGNLGSGVTEGITFKKAMPIMSGRKRVVVIANYDQYSGAFESQLKAFLVKGATTIGELNNYKLDFLLGTASYPTRLDVPKQNYTAPAPASSIDLSLAGVDSHFVTNPDDAGMLPLSTGMIMTGSGSITLEAGVTETEATSGSRNLVTIYADRVLAKASLKFDDSMVYREFKSPNPSVATLEAYEVGTDNTTPVEYATWWLANVPAEMYLMERETGTPHPYYNEHADFSMWQNKMVDYSWNKPRVTKTNSSVYTTENLVGTPVRGNVTYAVVKAKFSLYNIDEDPNMPGFEIISNRTWNGQKWSGVSVTHLPFSSMDKNLWMFTDRDGKRKFIACDKTMSNLVQNFQWMLYYPEAPGDVFAIDMTTYQRTKQEQDNAVLQGGTTILPGWYIFYYDAKNLHTGKWYDEMELYYYNGNKDASGAWQRGEYKSYTAAYYAGSYCYYRINLEDVDRQLGETGRFAVHRNDWFLMNIKKIKELGYPDEEDLAMYPDDALSDSWIEVVITVQDWRNGGRQEITIGNE